MCGADDNTRRYASVFHRRGRLREQRSRCVSFIKKDKKITTNSVNLVEKSQEYSLSDLKINLKNNKTSNSTTLTLLYFH